MGAAYQAGILWWARSWDFLNIWDRASAVVVNKATHPSSLHLSRVCRLVLTMHTKNRHNSYFPCPRSVTTLRNMRYNSSSGPVDRILLNRARPIFSPVIVRSPTERKVGADNVFANVVSSGCLSYAVFSFSESLGLGQPKQKSMEHTDDCIITFTWIIKTLLMILY